MTTRLRFQSQHRPLLAISLTLALLLSTGLVADRSANAQSEGATVPPRPAPTEASPETGEDGASAAREAAATLLQVLARGPAGDYADYVASHLSPRMRKKYGDQKLAGLLQELAGRVSEAGEEVSVVEVKPQGDGWRVIVHNELGDRYALSIFLTGDSEAFLDGFALELRPLPRQVSADKVPEAIAAHLRGLAGNERFSGAVIVATDGERIFAESYGFADRETRRSNTLDTPINLGSMNKMFTGLAIGQLVQRGKLDWKDTVGQHLPDYPNAMVREQVTLHHLLTHTSGIPSYWNEKYAEHKHEIESLEGLLATFVEEPLEFEPGEAHQYSNGGPVVLGRILEAVTGQSYYEYVREHIYSPAGMRDSGHFLRTDSEAGFAIGYHRASPDDPFEPNTGWLGLRGSSAGGGYASANDLLRFSRALDEEKLLPTEWLEKLWSPPREGPEEPGYGYLWGTGRVNGHRWVGHNGGGPGISADFRYFPEAGLTVIVLANQSGAAMRVSDWLVELITRTENL